MGLGRWLFFLSFFPAHNIAKILAEPARMLHKSDQVVAGSVATRLRGKYFRDGLTSRLRYHRLARSVAVGTG